jgi:acyl-[acyl-carrier-protein]-phospholipid O-acyltransferase/long-chain-fatty-acid--[acyl-carrier-protein] ligase
MVKTFLKVLYRPAIKLETLEGALETGERVILAPHHASYIDPVLFGLFAPGKPLVAISPSLARMKWFRFFKNCFDYVVIDQSDPMALKHIDHLWKKSSFLVLFPEPEPTTSGIMMKLSDTVIEAVERSGAWVVPARACNTQFTPFSRMGGRLVRVTAPKVTLLSGDAERVSGGGGNSADSRYTVRRRVEGMLADTMMLGIWDKKPIYDTLLEQRRLWGGKYVMAIEPDGSKIDWNGFITRIFLLQKIVEGLTKPDERIGIMLPNTLITLAAIIGAQHANREPAMINYSMGARSLKSACGTAAVGQIITSRKFVNEGKFQALVDSLSADGIIIRYLEDFVSGLSIAQKLAIALRAHFAGATHDALKYAERTAVVLFTSGSEGTPKPVALSHLNIQANTAQVRTTLDFYSTDVLVDLMPMFHSFGLCTGTIMPLSSGMPIAFYPTPLHYKKIPQYSYEVRGTIILGTNAFLAGYAKNADPFDFFEARYVICGGDKLREGTSNLWLRKFGIQVMEGYGVTECSPVVGVNRLGRNVPGSIGLPLPCVRTSLRPVEGVESGGRLLIKGPNVMKGYIQADGSILPPPEDGYDTGDIVSIDDEGFITIRGRARRFAKIGGEMVSLAQVEEAVQEVWPDDTHAVVSIPDEGRGEIIVLLTERASPDREELRAALTSKGLPELALPKKIISTESIPRIGVGKIDYPGAVKAATESR